MSNMCAVNYAHEPCIYVGLYLTIGGKSWYVVVCGGLSWSDITTVANVNDDDLRAPLCIISGLR